MDQRNGKFEMNDTHRNEIDLAEQPDVITICDNETCPTIKSDDGINTIIMVKSDGDLRSIEAGRNHGDYYHFESLENRAVGDAHQ